MAIVQLERRAFTVKELRAKATGTGRLLEGHAAVFNSLSEDLGGFREIIAPGAFAETIKQDDIRALWNHSPDAVLGRNVSGTLRLKEDEVGLAIEIDLPDTQLGRDMDALIARGDVSGMSFGFVTLSDAWTRGENGAPDLRTLLKVRLIDVSPVTFPAYVATDVQAARRSLEAWQAKAIPAGPSVEDLERSRRKRTAGL